MVVLTLTAKTMTLLTTTPLRWRSYLSVNSSILRLLCLKNKTTRNLNMIMNQNQLRLTQMAGGQHLRRMVLMKNLTSMMYRWKKASQDNPTERQDCNESTLDLSLG